MIYLRRYKNIIMIAADSYQNCSGVPSKHWCRSLRQTNGRAEGSNRHKLDSHGLFFSHSLNQNAQERGKERT